SQHLFALLRRAKAVRARPRTNCLSFVPANARALHERLAPTGAFRVQSTRWCSFQPYLRLYTRCSQYAQRRSSVAGRSAPALWAVNCSASLGFFTLIVFERVFNSSIKIGRAEGHNFIEVL